MATKITLDEKKTITGWMESKKIDMSRAEEFYNHLRKNKRKFTYTKNVVMNRENAYKEFIYDLCKQIM